MIKKNCHSKTSCSECSDVVIGGEMKDFDCRHVFCTAVDRKCVSKSYSPSYTCSCAVSKRLCWRYPYCVSVDSDGCDSRQFLDCTDVDVKVGSVSRYYCALDSDGTLVEVPWLDE